MAIKNHEGGYNGYCPADFARTLERETQALRTELERLKKNERLD